MKTKAALVLFFILVVGCSTTIEVGLSGQPDMNGGGNGAVVRIYELSGEGSFMEASFRAFWQEEGALGGSLIRSREETLYPDETKRFELELAEETKFIGVAANFRDPVQDEWRDLFPVEDVGDGLTVTVHNNRISVDLEGGGPPVIGMRIR